MSFLFCPRSAIFSCDRLSCVQFFGFFSCCADPSSSWHHLSAASHVAAAPRCMLGVVSCLVTTIAVLSSARRWLRRQALKIETKRAVVLRGSGHANCLFALFAVMGFSFAGLIHFTRRAKLIAVHCLPVAFLVVVVSLSYACTVHVLPDNLHQIVKVTSLRMI